MRYAVFAFVFLAGTPATAGGSLGIQDAVLSLGMLQDEVGEDQARFLASVDVAITNAHGLQGDLSFEETSHGTVGRLAGHAYMDPVPGQKYGLYFALSDLDGRSLSWAEFGVEGQLAVSDRSLIEGRTGLGRADDGCLDFILGGLSAVYLASSEVVLEVALDVAEFDEADFRAVSIDTGLKANYRPEGRSWGVYAEVIHSALSGRDGTGSETRLGVGFSLDFGTNRAVATDGRLFRDYDPVAGLVRRGLR